MRRIGNRLSGKLFGLLLAASLGFGVTSTFASAAPASLCLYDPPNAAGTCTSDADCQRKCNAFGGNPTGDCTTLPGCCACVY